MPGRDKGNCRSRRSRLSADEAHVEDPAELRPLGTRSFLAYGTVDTKLGWRALSIGHSNYWVGTRL